jgi:hypothetical protein
MAHEIRPPTILIYNCFEKKQIRERGLGGETRDYEEDHLIPLEPGGDATDPRNLWPEPYESPDAREKDVVENLLHPQVCSGLISLADAQNKIATDWYKVYMSNR